MAGNNSDLSLSTAEFSVNLLKELQNGDKEIFCSPASITLALAMTYAGAAERTATQMHSAMFNRVKNDEEVHLGLGQLISEVFNKSDDEVKLLSANRLYVEKTYKIFEEFIGTLTKYYQSELQMVEFSKDAESTRVAINDWVAKTTNEKIKNLLPKETITALTRLVIVNAVYFKGEKLKSIKLSKPCCLSFFVCRQLEIQILRVKHSEKAVLRFRG